MGNQITKYPIPSPIITLMSVKTLPIKFTRPIFIRCSRVKDKNGIRNAQITQLNIFIGLLSILLKMMYDKVVIDRVTAEKTM